jgi:hypothetical protein
MMRGTWVGVKHLWKATHRLLKDVWMLILNDIRGWMQSKSILTWMHVTGADEDSDIEHIWQTAYRIGFYRGGPVLMSALSGIDIALWDLKGTSSTETLFIYANK